MSILEDGVEEFKKMPTAGRIAVVVGLGGAIALGVYVHNKNANAGATSSVPTSATGGLVSGGGSGSSSDFIPPTLSGGVPPPPTSSGSGTPPTKIGGGNPPVGGKIPTPPVSHNVTTHIVQRGENLSLIAAHYHVKGGWQALYNANRSVIGSNPNLIFAGQKLTIPT